MVKQVQNKPVLVGIADKSPLMRAALKQLFSEDDRFRIVGASESSESFLKMVEDTPMDVAVVGWVIPPGDARFILDHLQPRPDAPRVVVYTGLESDTVPLQVMAHGGAAFVSKNEQPEYLLDTTAEVARGRMVFPYLDVSLINANPLTTLTKRELEEPCSINKGAAIFVATDPLDGSSNIDTNVSVGTIFSILPSALLEDGNNIDDACCWLQPGTAQLAAGYVIYGPKTALVITIGDGTMIFTLDRLTGEFRLTSEDVKVSPDTNEFAINSSNSRQWDGHIKAYVDDCLEGEEGPHGAN